MEGVNNNDEAVIIQPMNTEVLYQQDKAQIDTQISTAKAFPRNVTRAIQNSLAIACLDTPTASTCTYSVPRGGKAISGPSVHLAKILAQNWGNLRIESRVIAIDDKHVTSQGICFDLENNIAIKTEVKRSIMTRNGRMSDDMITVTGNAGNSIALRNAIFAVIPKGVTDKVYGEALKVITGDVSDETKLLKRRKQVFDGLKDAYGVNEQEVLSAVGKASLSHVTPEDLVVIIGIGQAIKDGDTTVDLAFRSNKSKVEAGNDKKAEVKKTQEKIKADTVAKTEEVKNEPAVVTEDFHADADTATKIGLCKTLEQLIPLYAEISDEDHDLQVLYADKKKELSATDGKLFNSNEMP